MVGPVFRSFSLHLSCRSVWSIFWFKVFWFEVFWFDVEQNDYIINFFLWKKTIKEENFSARSFECSNFELRLRISALNFEKQNSSFSHTRCVTRILNFSPNYSTKDSGNWQLAKQSLKSLNWWFNFIWFVSDEQSDGHFDFTRFDHSTWIGCAKLCIGKLFANKIEIRDDFRIQQNKVNAALGRRFRWFIRYSCAEHSDLNTRRR